MGWIMLPVTQPDVIVCESSLDCLKSSGKNSNHLGNFFEPLFSHCRKRITIPALIISLWPLHMKKAVC